MDFDQYRIYLGDGYQTFPKNGRCSQIDILAIPIHLIKGIDWECFIEIGIELKDLPHDRICALNANLFRLIPDSIIEEWESDAWAHLNEAQLEVILVERPHLCSLVPPFVNLNAQRYNFCFFHLTANHFKGMTSDKLKNFSYSTLTMVKYEWISKEKDVLKELDTNQFLTLLSSADLNSGLAPPLQQLPSSVISESFFRQYASEALLKDIDIDSFKLIEPSAVKMINPDFLPNTLFKELDKDDLENFVVGGDCRLLLNLGNYSIDAIGVVEKCDALRSDQLRDITDEEVVQAIPPRFLKTSESLGYTVQFFTKDQMNIYSANNDRCTIEDFADFDSCLPSAISGISVLCLKSLISIKNWMLDEDCQLFKHVPLDFFTDLKLTDLLRIEDSLRCLTPEQLLQFETLIDAKQSDFFDRKTWDELNVCRVLDKVEYVEEHMNSLVTEWCRVNFHRSRRMKFLVLIIVGILCIFALLILALFVWKRRRRSPQTIDDLIGGGPELEYTLPINEDLPEPVYDAPNQFGEKNPLDLEIAPPSYLSLR